MHLADLIRLGARPGAGLLLALTPRCPLTCAHCSTSSGPGAGPDPDGETFLRLVRSFTPESRPDVVLLSGGEPLLRPALVARLAQEAAGAGTRTALLSGMFFARGGRLPRAIARAVSGLDHFAASIDPFHEREVPRADALAALSAVRDLVPHVSVHVAAPRDAADAIAAEVRTRFGDEVPLLVSPVQPTGRGARLTTAPGLRPPAWGGAANGPAATQRGTGPVAGAQQAAPFDGGRHAAPEARALPGGPCPFAAWPLVDGDGTVYACTRQSLVRASGAEHLTLGHTSRDDWSSLRARALGEPLLRAVRAFGPIAVAQEFGGRSGTDPCTTCVGLGDAGARVRRFLDSPGGRAVERVLADLITCQPPRRLAALRGARPDHAPLVELGRRRSA